MMKFCSEAGEKGSQYLNSGKQQKVQDDEGNIKREWSRLLKENKIGGYRNGTILFPPAPGVCNTEWKIEEQPAMKI